MCWHLACVCVGTLSKSMKILEDAEETRDTDMPGMPQGGAFKALVGAVGKRVASQGVESVLVRVRDSEVSPSCACSQRGRCFEAVGVLSLPIPRRPSFQSSHSNRSLRSNADDSRSLGPGSSGSGRGLYSGFQSFEEPPPRARKRRKREKPVSFMRPRGAQGGAVRFGTTSRPRPGGSSSARELARTQRIHLTFCECDECAIYRSRDPFGKEQGASLGGRQSVKH